MPSRSRSRSTRSRSPDRHPKRSPSPRRRDPRHSRSRSRSRDSNKHRDDRSFRDHRDRDCDDRGRGRGDVRSRDFEDRGPPRGSRDFADRPPRPAFNRDRDERDREGFESGGRGGGFGGDRGRGRGRGRRRGGDNPDFDESKQRWGKSEDWEEEQEPLKEPEPEFGLSGALAAETNTVNGVVLLHHEPPEARVPTTRWRLYVFKNGEPFGDPLHIHRESCYLFGRERKIATVPIDHPSCSKQHAVIQYRLTEKEGPDGMMHASVRPYIMDLGSTNGTHVNGERIEASRYYELLEQDMIRFGNSTREYVLLKET